MIKELLVAHRGFRVLDLSNRAENRLVDFKKALKITKAVEFDIRLTKDNQVIIFHDHNFKRIGNVNKNVNTFTYDEIKQIPFFKKNPQWLPTLLDDFRTKIGSQYDFINIEIKPSNYSFEKYQIIFDAIKRFENLKAEIVVSSFSPKDQKEILKLPKRFKTGYLFWKIKNLNINLAKKFDYLHPWVKDINNPKNILLFKKLNLPMNVWTYKNRQEYEISKSIYGDLIYSYISDTTLD